MTDELFPEKPAVYSSLPLALRTGTSGLDRVVGKHRDAVQEMPTSVRRVACLLYLAHIGALKDSEDRIKFSLTMDELAAWYEVFVGTEPPPNALTASVEALKERGLATFHERRVCRATGEETNAYRFSHHVFPVTADHA